MSLIIIGQTISHDSHRYETVGDYFETHDGQRMVLVSDMANEDYEFLVMIHEMIEQHLCKKRGIPNEAITKFDEDFEAKRPLNNNDEPGDDPGAPYRKEHFFATSVERLIAAELKVDWKEYEKTINNL